MNSPSDDILAAIDNAVWDFESSDDAMRWTPGGPAREPQRICDMLGGGPTRVYWLPELPDPSAPTRAQLEAGVEIGSMVTDLGFEPATDLVTTDDVDVPVGEWTADATTITLTIRADTSQFVRNIRRLRANFRRIERALRRGDPKLSAMHADYARRRKARRRR